MSLWVVTSSSDPATIESDDFLLVAFFTCILGNGLFSAREWGVDEPRVVPFLPDNQFDRWFLSNFGSDYETCGRSVSKARLADVFESVVVGTPESRQATVAELEAIGDVKMRRTARERLNRKRSEHGWHLVEMAERWTDKLRADARKERINGR